MKIFQVKISEINFDSRISFFGFFRSAAVVGLSLTLNACVINQSPQPNDPMFAPVLKPEPIPDTALNGSLYRENSAMQLFDDGTARQVGDIITVVLEERTSSSKTSNVEILKDSDTSISPNAAAGTVLGTVPSLGNFGLSTGLIGEREFKGEAEADQSNRLTGNISVTVVDVFPNGTLVIRGEKWITLNRGSEFIRISGMIRPQDITPENTVMSTKIANARIAYSGTGELADSQEMGWLSRFFNSAIWPF